MRIIVAGIGLFGVLIGLLRLSALFASAFGGFLIYVAT